MRVLDLPTPALILDVDRVRRNATRMQTRLGSLGVTLRPHLKTAKAVQVAAIATAGGSSRLTVSTLAEAHGFAAAGFTDLLYAVSLAPAKVAQAAEIVRTGARLGVLVDDPAVATAIGRAAAREGITLDVYLEIDTGDHRTGMAPTSSTLLELARVIVQAPALRLQGVLTHAGQVYDCDNCDEVAQTAELERLGITNAAERLRAAGLPCDTVSAGSTPAAACAERLDGITEMRPGNYLFFDLFQWALGVCAWQELALSLLATVIGVAADRRRLIVDAGALALSKDHSAARLKPELGYGCLLGPAGERLGDLRLVGLDQEHGFVEPVTQPLPDLQVGDKVRILPSHACMTAACFAEYQVVDGAVDAGEIVERWPRLSGWYPA